MPTVSDEAIVLKVIKSGEADLIVSLLTKNMGRRTVFARAARKSKKRFVGALQPFSYINIIMNQQRNKRIETLTSADCIKGYSSLCEDLDKIYLASYYCELLDNLLMEGEVYPEIFDLMIFMMQRLQESKASLKHRIFFEMRLMNILGFGLDFMYCGQTCEYISGDTGFDVINLCFVNKNVLGLQNTMKIISEKTRRALYLSINVPLSSLGAVRMTHQEAVEALNVTRPLIQTHVTKPIKSLDLLERLSF